jgi:BTB/POZ domain
MIAKDLTKLFMNEKFSDITLNIGEDKVPAHKAILVTQSKFFEKVLAEDPDISEFTFQKHAEKEVYIEFLRFMYNNSIKDLEKNFNALLEFAFEYESEGLKKLCHLEIVSRVTGLFGRLTNRTRSVPLHILKDFEKVQKFHKMLLEMKELMRANAQEPIEKEPSSSTDDDIDEVIVMDISNFPVSGDESENENETNFNNVPKNIVIEVDEVFTDSMTKLMSTTLGTDENKNGDVGIQEEEKTEAKEEIQNNTDEPQINPKLTDESNAKPTPENIDDGLKLAEEQEIDNEKAQEKIKDDLTSIGIEITNAEVETAEEEVKESIAIE